MFLHGRPVGGVASPAASASPVAKVGSVLPRVRGSHAIIPCAAAPEAEVGSSGLSSSSVPATAVAPASDLATRRVSLRPWELQSDSSSLSTRRSIISAPPKPAPAADASQPASRSSSSSSRAAPAAAPCSQCGGRGVVTTTTHGRVPCPACQPWRQRPDYKPSQQLLSLTDLNLAALDTAAAAGIAPPRAGSRASSAGTAAAGAAEALGGSASSSSGRRSAGSGEGAAKRRGRKRGVEHGPMPESQRQAIRDGILRKGKAAKSEEHRRRIALALRDAHARNPELAMNLHRRCTLCGERGHNKRNCPQLQGAEDSKPRPAAAAKTGPSKRCSVCGEAGHNRRRCPQALLAAAGSEQGRKQLIVVEEVVDSLPAEDAGVASVAAPAASSKSGSSAAGSMATEFTAGREQPPSVAAQPPLAPSPPQKLPSPAVLAQAVPLMLAPPALTRGGQPVSLSPDGSLVYPLPASKDECVAQAAAAVLRAWEDGQRRQSLTLLLPQPGGGGGGGDGWPGGIRQQFRVALPMVEGLLLALKVQAGLQGRITTEMLDESDCVGAWQSERMAAVLFPTADTLPALRRIDDALSGSRLTLLINPQWHNEGQVVSDFGFGRARRRAELFVDAFDKTYSYRRVRILGDDVRVLRCYPGQWQVHWVHDPRQPPLLLACEESRPTYQRLLELLRAAQGSRASRGWLERMLGSSRGTWDSTAEYMQVEDGRQSSAAAGSSADDTAEQPSGAASEVDNSSTATGLLERDIVTNEPITRDLRLEPVMSVARWLGQASDSPRGSGTAGGSGGARR